MFKQLPPTREPGQRSKERESFVIVRPSFAHRPVWAEGNAWRNFVRTQPVAQACKITIADYIQSLDWQILPKESSQREELKSEVEYYTDGIEKDFGTPYDIFTDLLVSDLLDLPFGFGAEVIRENDLPNGKVVSVIPLDGATLAPTYNDKVPVVQVVPGLALKEVYFPFWAVSRVYMNARGELIRKEWGMPPPEAIFKTIEMMNRGDVYYANLLLDTPPPGILDLGDMEETAAMKWIDSFKTTMSGVEVFKIPVLYEHTTKVDYLPFGKPPIDLMFDRVTARLASLICSGYGITLSDIGFGEATDGGDTLAGSIRSERKSRRTGMAVVKKKVKAYWDQILPPELFFNWIDYDDEVNVAKGRALLSYATATGQLIEKEVITSKEARLQMIADGTFSIPIPEDIPEDEIRHVNAPTPERPGMLGSPQSPSLGGHGEVTKARTQVADVLQIIAPVMREVAGEATDKRLKSLIRASLEFSIEQVKAAYERYGDRISAWDEWYEDVLFDQKDVPHSVEKAIKISEDTLREILGEDTWYEIDELDEDEIALAFLAAYNASLQENGMVLNNAVFELGLVDIPEPTDVQFELQNREIKSEIVERASELRQLLNDGTVYFLFRIVLSEVRKMLSRPEYKDLIDEGIDTDTLMRDNVFVETTVLSIQERFRKIQDFRSERTSEFEVGLMERRAVEDLFRKSGLSLKGWFTTSTNPCEVCIYNESQGFVPLNFVYRSQIFGEVLQPLAHPKCQCELGFSMSDLEKSFQEEKFFLWDGK